METYWSKNMVRGLNFDLNYESRFINKLLVVQSSKQTVDKTIKPFEFSDFRVQVLQSFDIGLDLPKHIEKNFITSVVNVIEPKYDSSWVNMIKLYNHYLNYEEVCRFLDHVHAWHICITSNMPVCVVESGFVVDSYERIRSHLPYQSINCFSATDHEVLNRNYLHIPNMKCYVIDPLIALELFNHVLKEGISCSVEKTIRADKFAINYLTEEEHAPLD